MPRGQRARRGTMQSHSAKELQALGDELLLFGPPREERDTWLDEHLDTIMWPPHLRGLRVAMKRRQSELGDLASDLMDMTPRARRKAVQELPYRELGVAARLLEERRRARRDHPLLALRLAQTAVWIADLARPDGDGDLESRWSLDVQARARCDLGDAQRSLRRWRDAEASYHDAARILAAVPESSEGSYFSVSLAYLYEDLGELDWAAALLGQAAEALAGKHRFCWGLSSWDCLCRLGFVHLRRGDLGRAMAIFARLLVDRFRDLHAEHQSRVHLGAASCLLALDLDQEARRLIEDSSAFRARIEDRDEKVLVEWLACRLRVRLGDLELAVPRLQAIHRRFVAQGKPVDACLCALDLALAHVRKEGKDEGFLATFEKCVAAPASGWAQRAVRELRHALKHDPDPVIAARAAAFQIGHQWPISPGARAAAMDGLDGGSYHSPRLSSPGIGDSSATIAATRRRLEGDSGHRAGAKIYEEG
jgi:tetratricopeptide (TPR) repeat protein